MLLVSLMLSLITAFALACVLLTSQLPCSPSAMLTAQPARTPAPASSLQT